VGDLSRRSFLIGSAGTAGLAVTRGRTAQQAGPFDLVIAGGQVIDPAQNLAAPRDIGIRSGRIARIAESLAADPARERLDARGRIVTPGLIDAHVHVYDGVASVGIEADAIGLNRGVTAVIDGGSAGATTFPGFRAYVVRQARTRVYALLNISSPGMTVPNETSDLAFLNAETAAAVIRANRDVIVGLKVRMLAGLPPGQDLEVMRRTRAAADLAGVPITLHIGGQTSPLSRILEFLRPGDVITHALRRDGSILDAGGRVDVAVRSALRDGVHLDVGHGRGNLDFDVAERVLAQGVTPTLISSDVHRGNAVGPVFDLPTTLSKFLLMGMSLEAVIHCATSTPARIFDFGAELGTLREGAPADVSVFELVDGEYEFVDSGGKRRTGTRRLAPYAAIRDGRWFGLRT